MLTRQLAFLSMVLGIWCAAAVHAQEENWIYQGWPFTQETNTAHALDDPWTVIKPQRQDVKEAIVKIYKISNRPDYYNPWSMQGPRSLTGSGCVIKGRKILTNAHLVSDETFMQVRRYGEARKYRARVAWVAHVVDLALLDVEDKTFFDDVEPLAIGELPLSRQETVVYGFPFGGDTLSVTKGVISRIEHRSYTHSSYPFLAGQIDAAINPGNSGGPVLVNDLVIGVVMQHKRNAQNIGYMVPAPVLHHFFLDLEDGSYDGFPSLGIVFQDMENPDLKARYNMAPDQTGVLITRVVAGSPAEFILKPGDVLLRLGDQDIANDGTVEFRPGERTSMFYVVQSHQIGEHMDVHLLRNGRRMLLDVVLRRSLDKDQLVPKQQYDIMPSYFIYGGLVFSRLTKDYLEVWSSDWYNRAPKVLVAILSDNYPETAGQEVVLLTKVLAAEVNEGYHDINSMIVDRVNGEKILNLEDLVRKIIRHTNETYLALSNERGVQVVLDRSKAEAANPDILRLYHIPRDRSEDLDAIQPEPLPQTQEERAISTTKENEAGDAGLFRSETDE